MNMISGQLSLF